MANLMMCLDANRQLHKMPDKVIKKFHEFCSKFLHDSKRRSIHLEPYSEALDSKVRSARIGDDYRAIVIAPDKGDNFVLVWIDHHDEAYNWCRNKRFEAHQLRGVFQIYDEQQVAGVVGASTRICAEMGFHYPLDDLTDDDLFSAGVPRLLIPSVRAIKHDDAFFEVSDYLPKEASQVLCCILCGMSLDEALTETFGQMDAEIQAPSSPGDFSHLDQVMSMDLVLVEGEEHLKDILSKNIEEWRIYLHPCQRKLVECKTNGPMKVYGTAGTGKTVALIHRAVHLALNLDNEKDKVLVTTYTTNLSVTLDQLIRRFSPEAVNKIEVINLHQLARKICINGGWKGNIVSDSDRQEIWRSVFCLGVPSGFDHEFIREEYETIVEKMCIETEDAYLTAVRSGRPRLDRKQRKLLWPVFSEFNLFLQKRNLLTYDGLVHRARLRVERGDFPSYRHVLVDELQDFGLEALRFIAAISNLNASHSDPLCMVGDGHQRIYNVVPIPLSRAGINIRGRSRRLKINYRTSEQIRRWAHGLLTGIAVDDLDGGNADIRGDRSVFTGPSPQIRKSDDMNLLANYAVTWIESLMRDQGFASHEICITPNADFLRNALKANGFQTFELKAKVADPGQLEPGVRFGSMQRIKGLEFRAVIMLLDDGAHDNFDIRHRFERYVAATRAREHLMVLVHEDEDK